MTRPRPLRLLTLCTGNVMRSVVLAELLLDLADDEAHAWEVRSAGTHAIEGSAISGRTLTALSEIGRAKDRVLGHRSHELVADDVEWADVIIAAESAHAGYVARLYPAAAGRTVVLGQFVDKAPAGATLDEQLAVASAHSDDPSLDVPDPAGRDQVVYDACARELWHLARRFAKTVNDR